MEALATGLGIIISAAAWGASPGTVSDLEQVTVTAPRENGTSLGGAAVTQDDIQLFNRDTLDQAIQLASGTSVSAVGARNETNIWIRGFDRWRVPLYQDGIPVYLPVDNRIDFGRFSTVDISEIQISKGFASVIDGPGAMGGSVNLVSRVVSQPLETDARLGSRLDSTGSYAGWTSDLLAGTRQPTWFAQAAGSFASQNHFRLADSFTPGTIQPAGNRLESSSQDYKINLKAGFTPASGDEYTLNYIDQVGRKDNAPPDSIIPPAALRQVKYWTWPSWNKESLYWLSKNLLDDRGSYVKTRVYVDRFYNQLDSYDTIDYSTQNTPKSFNSTYDDRAVGGSAELSETLPGGADTLRFAAHYRWDEHRETESTRNAPAPIGPWYQQPWEKSTEATWSLAAENIYRPTERWDLTAGLSYDARHLIGASQWVASGVTPPYGYSFAYPVADKHALNGEIAAVYRYSSDGAVHVSYADRSRFPTLFEMYSTRFGTFQNNPTLKPERSHYAQIGIADTFGGIRTVVNVFFARVSDAIVAVPLSATLSENQNVGVERRTGFEVELSRRLNASLDAGINYSHLTRDILESATVATDTPGEKIFAFLDWQPLPSLKLVPSIDWEGNRWLQSATNNTLYYRGGSVTRVDFKAEYAFRKTFRLDIGVTNLTDHNYVIEDGYHAPGREYFANVRFSM